MAIHGRKTRVALLSVISNTTLIIIKLIVGVLIGSVAVMSEAVHSAVDLLAAIIALIAVHTAAKPADDDHPFGHGKIENVSGTIEALLIFAAAAWIIYEAVKRFLSPGEHLDAGWGVGVMLVSAVANIIVSQMLFKVGRETDSIALQADAWHLRTDVYTSAGVMAGLGIIVLGGWLFPHVNLTWVDPLAACLVAILILRAAWDLTRQSGRDLLDARLPEDEEAWIHDFIMHVSPAICSYHKLRTRKAGSTRFVEFHLLLPDNMTVDESHDIAEEITTGIEEHFLGSHVTVHVEPCGGICEKDAADEA